MTHLRQLPALFWLPALLITLLFLSGLSNPTAFAQSVHLINQAIFQYFGGFYLWFVFLTLLIFVGIGLSPWGKIRLGGAETKPEYSFVSWFSMLFCAGMGTGFLFWGAAEPLHHFMSPPIHGQYAVQEKIQIALSYTLFHWGLSPWAIYGMTALAIGFFTFNLQRQSGFGVPLAVGEEFRLHQKLSRFLTDLLTLLATVFGVAATFGMGVLIIEGGLHTLFHLESTPTLKLGIILLISLLYLLSSIQGLQKGIRVLSNLSMLLSLVLLLSVWLFHPQLLHWDSLPGYLASLPKMSLGLGAFQEDHWVRDWTVQYWSWWIAWAPFVGAFIALISRGRTFREMILAVLITPTLFSYVWFCVMGQAAIDLQIATGFAGNEFDFTQVHLLFYNMLTAYSHSPLLSWISLLLVGIFISNSADSAIYTLSCLCRQDFENQPPAFLQIGWGVLFALLTLILLLFGGMPVLRKITTITVLPFTLILAVTFIYLIYALSRKTEEGKTHQTPQESKAA